ncbi:hypothetical protein B0H13DRAFT_2322185 [Mycena leptocephala]|nr:hypothetical protein B0H13DRAFT_2322185 [Mycena leptocephala]
MHPAVPVAHLTLVALLHTATAFCLMGRPLASPDYHRRSSAPTRPKALLAPTGRTVRSTTAMRSPRRRCPSTVFSSPAYHRHPLPPVNVRASHTREVQRASPPSFSAAVRYCWCRVLEPSLCHRLPHPPQCTMRDGARIPNTWCTTAGVPSSCDGCFSSPYHRHSLPAIFEAACITGRRSKKRWSFVALKLPLSSAQ